MKQVNVGIVVVVGAEGKEEACVEGTVCAHEIQGVVRREDVRATEKEKVDVGEGFRVGDVIRAVVVGFKAFPMPAMWAKVRDITDQSRGSIKLLLDDGKKRIGRHLGEEREWQHDVCNQLERIHGSSDGGNRNKEGCETIVNYVPFPRTGKPCRATGGMMLLWPPSQDIR